MKEIIVQFKDEKALEFFIGQMMDGIGEDIFNFTHWHKDNNGRYIKKYDSEGRLVCTANIFEEEEY